MTVWDTTGKPQAYKDNAEAALGLAARSKELHDQLLNLLKVSNLSDEDVSMMHGSMLLLEQARYEQGRHEEAMNPSR